MKNKEVVGVDVSKNTLDVFILRCHHHFVVSNCEEGFVELMETAAEKLGRMYSEVLFCFEDTGRYSKR
jgi:transposase